MKQPWDKILAFLLVGVVFGGTSCANNASQLQKKSEVVNVSLDIIKGELESGRPIERQSPFAVRTFDPTVGDKWIGNAVAYGCYRKGQAPGVKGPSKEEILEDLMIITKHWNLIRVYGADDDTERILEVIRERNLPIRVMLGVWLENETGMPHKRKENSNQVLRGIALARHFNAIVAAVSVGNETQVSWAVHRMSQDDFVRYVRAVRNNVTLPVTTADDWSYWITPESKAVAEEFDVLVTHIHPLWNGKTLDASMEWTEKIYHDVQKIHPGKELVIGEIGWATNYDATKKGQGEQGSLIKGEVSTQAQARFLTMCNEWINRNKITTFLFEAFDEPWKGGGENSSPNEVEKHWGVFYEDRTPKEAMRK